MDIIAQALAESVAGAANACYAYMENTPGDSVEIDKKTMSSLIGHIVVFSNILADRI